MTPMMSMFLRFLLAVLLFVVLASLADYALAATPVPQAAMSVLDTHGPQAGHVLDLWRVFLLACCVVFAGILLALFVALRRAPRVREDSPPDIARALEAEPGPTRYVTRASVACGLALVALVVASVFTDRALARMSLDNAVNIEVTSHQWWWGARYVNGGPSDAFVTANEIHIPVGLPVVVKLNADDVIHSLWVPSLSGKKDLIPGRTSVMRLQADTPGVYRGQCAEFCGLQHAMMGLLVIADPPERWNEWVKTQRQPAPEPQDALAQRGKSVFESSSCAMCHAIQGTLANGQRGPDLTHVGSRVTLAAGTLQNTPQELAGWIRDPQTHKPGTNMPATPLSNADLDAVVAYLGTLK